jgi:hypothetical protein
MIRVPSPYEFLQFQIAHYTKRLSDATTTEEKAFVRRELYNLKKRNNAILDYSISNCANDPVLAL